MKTTKAQNTRATGAAPTKAHTMEDDFGDTVREARVLPIGGGGNIICGEGGFWREMANRRMMNREMIDNNTGGEPWDLPTWESLRVYFRNGEYLG